MANERIESGRVGLQMAGGNVPMVQVSQQPVDYIGFRAQAATANTMSQILDRMSSAVFKAGEEVQTEAGLKYVAENPPTAQQLEEAKNGNLEPLDIKGGFNVFDKAVRKARSFEIAGHFEMEFRNKATELLEKAKTGQVSSEELTRQLNANADAYVKVVSRVDGEAALKFRASAATDGYKVVAAARENEIAINAQKNKVKLDTDFINSMKLLKQDMQNNAFVDPVTGQRISLAQRVDTEKESLIKRAAAIGGAKLSAEYEKKFDQESVAIKAEIIAEAHANGEFGGTQQGLLKAITDDGTTSVTNPDGTVTRVPGKYTELLSSMSFTDKAAFRVEARRIQNEKDDARKADNELETEQDSKRVAQLESDYMRFGNPKVLSELRAIAIKNPKAISISHVEKLPQSRQSSQPDNFWGLLKVKDEIKSKLIKTTADLQDSMARHGVSAKHANDLYAYRDSDTSRSEKAVDGIARKVVKLVPGATNIPAEQQTEYFQFLDTVRREHERKFKKWESEGKKGLPPEKEDIANQIVVERRKALSSENVQRIVNYLNENYKERLGVEFSEDSLYTNDLRDSMKIKKFTDPQINEVEKYLKQLKQKKEDLSNIRLE